MEVSIVMGEPQNDQNAWFTMGNPIFQWMRTGGTPMTQETSMCIYIYIWSRPAAGKGEGGVAGLYHKSIYTYIYIYIYICLYIYIYIYIHTHICKYTCRWFIL